MKVPDVHTRLGLRLEGGHLEDSHQVLKPRPPLLPITRLEPVFFNTLLVINFFGAQVEVVVGGYLHSFKSFNPDTSSMELYRDIAVAQMSLSRTARNAEHPVKNIQLARQASSLVDRYADTRQYGRKEVDKVPLYRIGIRNRRGGWEW